jgi:hypothetical protein
MSVLDGYGPAVSLGTTTQLPLAVVVVVVVVVDVLLMPVSLGPVVELPPQAVARTAPVAALIAPSTVRRVITLLINPLP